MAMNKKVFLLYYFLSAKKIKYKNKEKSSQPRISSAYNIAIFHGTKYCHTPRIRAGRHELCVFPGQFWRSGGVPEGWPGGVVGDRQLRSHDLQTGRRQHLLWLPHAPPPITSPSLRLFLLHLILTSSSSSSATSSISHAPPPTPHPLLPPPPPHCHHLPLTSSSSSSPLPQLHLLHLTCSSPNSSPSSSSPVPHLLLNTPLCFTLS